MRLEEWLSATEPGLYASSAASTPASAGAVVFGIGAEPGSGDVCCANFDQVVAGQYPALPRAPFTKRGWGTRSVCDAGQGCFYDIRSVGRAVEGFSWGAAEFCGEFRGGGRGEVFAQLRVQAFAFGDAGGLVVFVALHEDDEFALALVRIGG